MFASSVEAVKTCVKVLTGRGAIMGNENILKLVYPLTARCRTERRNRQSTMARVVRVETRRLVFPSCLL
jgi:hypothetical protein